MEGGPQASEKLSGATSLRSNATRQQPGARLSLRCGPHFWHSLGGSFLAMLVSKQVFTLPLHRAKSVVMMDDERVVIDDEREPL